jgi:hypothetical protein
MAFAAFDEFQQQVKDYYKYTADVYMQPEDMLIKLDTAVTALCLERKLYHTVFLGMIYTKASPTGRGYGKWTTGRVS